MPHPTTARPRGQDIAHNGWAAITVRVAWVLLRMGVAVRPAVLKDARDHVLLNLPRATSVVEAEDRAEQLVEGFVTRAKGTGRSRSRGVARELALSTSWRSELERSLSPAASSVLYLHYADGFDLPTVSRESGHDLLALEAAQEGLREVVRVAAASDGVPIDGWTELQVDRLLHRLASMGRYDSPDLAEVAQGKHAGWVHRCVRCRRTWTLVSRGVLTPEDLVPPLAPRPGDRARVLAIHFQPAGRVHRKRLAKEMPGIAFPLGDDLLLVDAAQLEEAQDVLIMAAEVGRPDRDHVRAAMLEGPGRWSRHGLVGPLVDRVEVATGAMPWGIVDGLGELPEALPRAPSARPAWLAVAVLALLTFGILREVFRPLPAPVDHPLEVSASAGRGGVWVAFDVDEAAWVFVVRQRQGKLELLLDSEHMADKIAHATGDGSYRLHTEGEAVLVASASHRLNTFPEMVSAAQAGQQPLVALRSAIHSASPTTDVWTYTR